MKLVRTLPVMVFLGLFLTSPLAALDINSGLALGCSGRYDTGDPSMDFLLGLRCGTWTDLAIPLNGKLYLAPEIGFLFISWDSPSGQFVLLSEFPLLLKLGLKHKFGRLEALAGPLVSLDMGTGVAPGFHAVAGIRASLGAFYIEATLAVNIPPHEEGERIIYPRIFSGYRISLAGHSPEY